MWADEDVGRDAQLLAQPDDHGDGQGPVAIEDFNEALVLRNRGLSPPDLGSHRW